VAYVKPAFCGDEPADVRQYGEAVKEFPHETTGDQFFSESQFESYRMLGLHTIEHICSQSCTTPTVDQFEARVRKYLAIDFQKKI
jgi:hypothetical protein